MAAQELQTLDRKLTTTRDLLNKMRPELETALPKHLNVDRMCRVAMTLVQRVPKLLDVDQRSFLGGIMKAAQLGLEPDGALGLAWLLPYGNEAQLIIGYQGWADLVRRSDHISNFVSQVVYSQDHFEYQEVPPLLLHKRPWPPVEVTQGDAVAAYCWVQLKDGGVHFEVMSRKKIEGHMKRSAAVQKKRPTPWKHDLDWEWMWRKTAIIQCCKLLPKSIEYVYEAARLAEAESTGHSQHLDGVLDTTAEEVPATEPTPEDDEETAARDALQADVEVLIAATGINGADWDTLLATVALAGTDLSDLGGGQLEALKAKLETRNSAK